MASTIWKGRLNFGLVSIPIKLVRAARAEKIHLHKLQRETGKRVRQMFVPVTDVSEPEAPRAKEPEAQPAKEITQKQTAPVREPLAQAAPAAPQEPQPKPGLSRAEIVHGFEYGQDQYVEFEPEELEKIAPRNSAEMHIAEFVKFGEIDPVFLETSYYVLPDSGGDKPYALLFDTLKKTGYAAIGEFVMHRRDQVIVMRPGSYGLIAHTMFYVDEVKRDNEYHAETKLTAGKEMELAVKLVEALAAPFEPEKFKDRYLENLRNAISQKVESGAVTQTESVAPKAPVVDIMTALQESLAKARKPPTSESRPAAVKKPKRAGGGSR